MKMTQVLFFPVFILYNSEGGKHFVFSLDKVCIHLNLFYIDSYFSTSLDFFLFILVALIHYIYFFSLFFSFFLQNRVLCLSWDGEGYTVLPWLRGDWTVLPTQSERPCSGLGPSPQLALPAFRACSVSCTWGWSGALGSWTLPGCRLGVTGGSRGAGHSPLGWPRRAGGGGGPRGRRCCAPWTGWMRLRSASSLSVRMTASWASPAWPWALRHPPWV